MEADKNSGGVSTQGRIVMATVKGDVHDIGKNIVGVVLGCNNYEVIDLGVMVSSEKILETARERGANIIGLSGLITPSLDEMVHVAQEMQRQGFQTPLLIGGATTSAIHTAVKIAPAYEQPVLHVLDASRAVGVVNNLISTEIRGRFVETNRVEQDKARQKYLGRRIDVALLTLSDARQRKADMQWSMHERPPKPSFLGLRVLDDFPLTALVPFIDWSPLFHAWQLKGTYPRIFEDSIFGPRAVEVFQDAWGLVENIVADRSLHTRAVYGFWPANSVGDDIQLFSDESRTKVIATLHTLRQQTRKAAAEFNYALADFIAPASSGIADYIGAFAVTAGIGVDELCAKFESQHDDYNSIMAKALADRLAEAFAECLHKRIREEWNYGRGESLSVEDLIKERYRGIRPAPGYPAQPDHTEKQTLFNLLDAGNKAGIQLTESFAMMPASSVCGLYFSHPDAQYFSVGRIGRDQLEDYAARKKMPVEEMERWLRPNLG
jgi:5-methyltetrahydrofolate--homocysteine methyltransferase